MTEQITLEGDNILDDYKPEDVELSDDEETPAETKPNKISLRVPELKGPEYYETLRKIKEYKRIFEEECKHVCLKNEKKLTYEDLLSKIEECKDAAANRKKSQLHKMGFKAVLGVAESYIAPAVNMNLKGFTNTAINDDEIMKTLDEIALLQDWTTKNISPEQRLLLGLGELAFRVNVHNKAAEKEMKLPEKEGNYDDL